jgi:dTDP-4-amino-4,6-dideoxygalactose transaminase
MKLRLSRSIVGREEAEAVSRVILDDGYLGMGAEVDRFEAEIATFLGVPRASVACVNSGTAAVHLAVQSAVSADAEVLVPSLTFVATFQGISAAGAVPVPCDVRPETATLDLADAARRLTPRTKAIMPVHYASYPANLDEVYAFAAAHGIRVIEDAAHAFGCTHRGRMVGSFGDVACFSFDGIKNITSGEGGLVVSADETVMARVRDARLLGVNKDTEKRYRGERSWEFDVDTQGYRYHMSNLFAAIGRVQLRRFVREFAPARVALARRYRSALDGISGLALFETDLGPVVPHIQPVRVLGGHRNRVREQLGEAGIETGIHYKPNHLLTYFGGGRVSLPSAEMLYNELLSLPLHPGLSDDDVARVSASVAEVIAGCPQ